MQELLVRRVFRDLAVRRAIPDLKGIREIWAYLGHRDLREFKALPAIPVSKDLEETRGRKVKLAPRAIPEIRVQRAIPEIRVRRAI